MIKCKCPRCDRLSGILDALEMSDTGLGDKFCINCGIYFYDVGQARGNTPCSRAKPKKGKSSKESGCK